MCCWFGRLVLGFGLWLVGGLFVVFGGEGVGEGKGGRGPSFVVFLADDLGYMDVGAYNPGCFYDTPNIDGLAASGMRFTSGYAVSPVCSPTRFGIQTGRYPSRRGATDYFSGRRSGRFAPAALHDRMDLEEVSLGEALGGVGYVSFFGGKWHLGPSAEFWPEGQGYDVNVGGWSRGGPYGGGKYFSPYGNPRLEDGPVGEHLPDRLAGEACRFIERHRGDRFLVFLSFYSVHTPLLGREDLVEKYRGRLAGLGVDEGEVFGLEERVFGEGERRVRVRQGHAVYGAMVEALDLAVGRVLGKLRELGLEDEVVVCFTSDNGGLSTSEGSPTSNVPLRGGKGWVYEGGIREPFLVRWPGVTEGGSVCDVPVSCLDFFPTFVGAAGGVVRGAGPIDGVDLMPLLRGGDGLERDALFWHYPHYSNQGGFPAGAVRMGDWKLVERLEDGRVHLFDLGSDVGERRDLAGVFPGRVAVMRGRLHGWYREVGARFLERLGEDGPAPWRPPGF